MIVRLELISQQFVSVSYQFVVVRWCTVNLSLESGVNLVDGKLDAFFEWLIVYFTFQAQVLDLGAESVLEDAHFCI